MKASVTVTVTPMSFVQYLCWLKGQPAQGTDPDRIQKVQRHCFFPLAEDAVKVTSASGKAFWTPEREGERLEIYLDDPGHRLDWVWIKEIFEQYEAYLQRCAAQDSENREPRSVTVLVTSLPISLPSFDIEEETDNLGSPPPDEASILGVE